MTALLSCLVFLHLRSDRSIRNMSLVGIVFIMLDLVHCLCPLCTIMYSPPKNHYWPRVTVGVSQWPACRPWSPRWGRVARAWSPALGLSCSASSPRRHPTAQRTATSFPRSSWPGKASGRSEKMGSGQRDPGHSEIHGHSFLGARGKWFIWTSRVVEGQGWGQRGQPGALQKPSSPGLSSTVSLLSDP